MRRWDRVRLGSLGRGKVGTWRQTPRLLNEGVLHAVVRKGDEPSNHTQWLKPRVFPGLNI